MTEELLLNKSFADIGDKFNSFTNNFKAEVLMKGYQIKKEKSLKGKNETGNILTYAKKLEGFGSIQINVEIRRNQDDLWVLAYSSSRKEVSSSIVEDLEKICDKICCKYGGVSSKPVPSPAPAPVTIIQQGSVKETIIKEVVREIVKIKCPYCGVLVDHTLSQCPNCSGKLG